MADVVDYSKMKVSELKELCKDRGLATSGNKAKLVERLESGVEGEHNEADDSVVDHDDGDQEEGGMGDEDEDDLLNEDDDEKLDEEDDVEVTKDAELQLAEPVAEKPADKSAEIPAAKPESPASKPVTVTTSEPADEPTSPASPNGTKKITFSKIVAPQSTPKAEDKDEDKMKILSPDEILARRQARFGVQSEEDKKKARAERFGISVSEEKTDSKEAAGKGKIAKSAPVDVEILKKRAERFGTVVSTTLSKVSEKERAEKRKARFGDSPKETSKDTSDAKKKRAERFGLTV